MYIGKRLQERMLLFGMSPQNLADTAFVDIHTVQGLLEDRIPVEHVDSFDMDLLANALSCDTAVLTEGKRDLLSGDIPGVKNPQTFAALLEINNLMRDMAFVNSILQESNSTPA